MFPLGYLIVFLAGAAVGFFFAVNIVIQDVDAINKP